MRYLCLAYGDRKKIEALSKDEFAALIEKFKMHDEEIKKSGHYISGESLEWTVMSVRPKDGKPVISDGPFVETREVVGGLVVIEARDLNEAMRIASLHPAANAGEHLGCGIEVRPYAGGCHQ